jgi:hypothetical protein
MASNTYNPFASYAITAQQKEILNDFIKNEDRASVARVLARGVTSAIERTVTVTQPRLRAGGLRKLRSLRVQRLTLSIALIAAAI